MIRLGEIVKVTAGQAAPKEFSNDGLPFIRAGHLKELLGGKKLESLPKVSVEIANKKRLKTIPSGTIIFAKSGMSATKNRIYITKGEAYFVSHLAGILPNSKISGPYLSRYLSWYNPTNLILDSAYPSIRLEDINNLKIPLPPLDQQKKIAAILDAADSYRQKTKALITKYEELTQSLFLDMFGDPVGNPKEWEKVKLNTLCHKITDGTHKTPKYQDSGIIFLSAKNIKNYKLNKLACKYISKSEHELLSKRCNVEKGDILLTKSGSLGMAAMIDFDFEFSIFESLALVKYSREAINGSFLLFYLNTPSTQFQYHAMTKGVGVKHLHLTDLRKLSVITPPRDQQNEFMHKVQAIEAQKAQAQASLVQAEDLFNSLLQKAFKGELV